VYEYTHGGNVYGSGGEIREGLIDFSSSINPLGMPEKAVAAAKSSAAHAVIYPDSASSRLASELETHEGVGAGEVLCAAGASDIIFRAVNARKPKKILVTAPAFADYERAGTAAGAATVRYYLDRQRGFGIEEDITGLIHGSEPDIGFVCNPNNPTGSLTDMEMTVKIAGACRSVGALLVIDECFLDFVSGPDEYSAKSMIGLYPDILIVKSLTKVFAMPGLRVGYCICGDKEFLDRMRFCGPDWPLTNISQAAGIAALESGWDHIEKSREYIDAERGYIISELTRIGLTVYPSRINYIFFHCPWDIDLAGDMCKKGVLIRDCANFHGLARGYYRVAVLTGDKNRLLIAAIGEVLNDRRNIAQPINDTGG